MRSLDYIVLWVFLLFSSPLMAQQPAWTVEEIIGDIIGQAGVDEQGAEELETTLYDLHTHPINLNTATADELSRLPFLTPDQIDEIQLYVGLHPMDALQEVLLVPGLGEYEARLLGFFACVQSPAPSSDYALKASDFRPVKNELFLRGDVRNIEGFTTDPVYARLRYKLYAGDRIEAGFSIDRMPGEKARNMRYGGYVSLSNMGPFSRIVLGNYQAEFGMGLVTAGVYRMGKSSYVLDVGMQRDGLSRTTSIDGSGLHGVGLTAPIPLKGDYHLDINAWYSVRHVASSAWHHGLGTNLTFRHRRLKVGVTVLQDWLPTQSKAVIGANFRYNWGKVDWFGEVAAAQDTARWGMAATTGLRLRPITDLGLILLYRYYSPDYHNPQAYSLSETSQITDENGLYLGLDVRRIAHWRLSWYGDVFRFSGPKYQIPFYPSWGFDTRFKSEWTPSDRQRLLMHVRARLKGRKTTSSLRAQYRWGTGGWMIESRMDGNLCAAGADSPTRLGYGAAVMQDVRYQFQKLALTIDGRLCGFYAPGWDNRLYVYEQDVLYANSNSALYGEGGKWYINLKYRYKSLSTYLRLSQTIYTRRWAEQRGTRRTHTDIHWVLCWVI